jgi:hypothetical protein
VVTIPGFSRRTAGAVVGSFAIATGIARENSSAGAASIAALANNLIVKRLRVGNVSMFHDTTGGEIPDRGINK